MDNTEKYKHWEEYAQYDLETAKVMLTAGRYLYVAFMCQQAVEKLLKGIHILYTGQESPKTHNVWFIFNSVFGESRYRNMITDESFDQKVEGYKLLFADLVYYYISERYPSYKRKISKSIDERKASELLDKSEEVFLWLQSLTK